MDKKILLLLILLIPQISLAELYPLYIPQDENSSYADPRFLIQDGIGIRITDYPNSSETLPSVPYPETIEEDGCVFLQNTLFNLVTGQLCSNSCGNMCYSSCSGGCGESCGGPVKWLAAQMVEGMYIGGSGDFVNVGDCYLSYEYQVKVRGCSDGWYPESNCGTPADCNGLSFLNTGLSLTPTRPGGFPNYDPALYTTIDLFNLEVDVNVYGRAFLDWRGCGCVWYRPWCCVCPEGTLVSTTLNDSHATANPVDAKAVLKAESCTCGQLGCSCSPGDDGKTKANLALPYVNTTLNNFNVNIFNWSCNIWGWNPCQDLGNWLNGIISGWIQGTVEDSLNDAIQSELGSGFEYILDIPPGGTNPFDIVVAPPVQGGLDFVSDQLRQGLEGDLKDTLVESFEGFRFYENNYYVTDLAGCGVYADIDVIVRGCYDSAGNIKALDTPPVGCYWASDGFTELHPGGDPADNDGLTYQRTGVNLTSDPTGFIMVDNSLYTTLQLYDLELDVDAYFTVRFEPGNPYCNWVGNYAFPQRTGVINATARGVAETLFDGTSIALNFTGFQIDLNDLYLAAVNWSCCAPSQANCQWDVCKDISNVANLFLSSYAATLLGDIINQEIGSLLNSFFDKDGDGVPDPLFDLNQLLAEIPLGDIGLRLGLALNLETSPEPPFGATLRANSGIFPTTYHPCVPLAERQGIPDTPSPPPQWTDLVPKLGKNYMLGVAISDELINQMLYSLYSAGFLCIDIDPESRELFRIGGKDLSSILSSVGITSGEELISPEIISIVSTFLNTDAFALMIPELWELSPHAPIKISLRPMNPPEIRLGSDNGMVEIAMRDMNLDFYTEFEKRPIRAFSIKTDASLGFTINGLTLMSGDPNARLVDITVGEPHITSTLTFNESIPVNKADLEAVVVNALRIAAPALSGLLSGIKPLLTPPGVNPNKPEGDLFGLTIPETFVVTDVRSSDDTYDNYLGLYINLGGTLCWSCLLEGFSFSLPLPSPPLISQQIEPRMIFTSASDGRRVWGLGPEAEINGLLFTRPSGTIEFNKTQGASLSYRIDSGLWSDYKNEDNIYLVNLLEGRHLIEFKEKDRFGVVSGVKSVLLRVDSIPPKITVERSWLNEHLNINVSDTQTPEDSILVKWRWDNGEWTQPGYERGVTLSELNEGEHILEVKAIDDAGNESSYKTRILITRPEGCGCNAGNMSRMNLLAMVLIFAPCWLIYRRQIRVKRRF